MENRGWGRRGISWYTRRLAFPRLAGHAARGFPLGVFQERMARVGPVLVRELRAQARSPVLPRVRLLAGGLAVGGLGLMGLNPFALRAGSGVGAFLTLHGGLLCLLCLLGPALTADAISRERREGTLPLLWLCCLRPGDVLLGKLAAHGLALFAAWLAAAPVLLLPLLLGGVSLTMILVALAVEAGVGGVCLASGLLASTWSRHAERSLLSAYFIAGSVVALGFWFGGFVLMTGAVALAPRLAGLPPWARALAAAVPVLLLSAGLIGLLLRAARDGLRVYWHRPVSLEDIVVTPAQGMPPVIPAPAAVPPGPSPSPPEPRRWLEDGFTQWLVERQRRLAAAWLGREPYRALALRLGPDAYFAPTLIAAAMLLLWALAAFGGWFAFAGVYAFFFRWAVVLTAAWAWRSEVWRSLMDTLLVTPQPARALLAAHVWAHHRLFGAPLAMLAVIAAVEAAVTRNPAWLHHAASAAALFWAAPRIGAWASLRFRHFTAAMLVTVGLALLLPWAVRQTLWFQLLRVLALQDYPGLAESLSAVPQVAGLPVLLLAGGLAGRLAARQLESRQGFEHLRRE